MIQILLLYLVFIPDPSLTSLGWIGFTGAYTSLISTCLDAICHANGL